MKLEPGTSVGPYEILAPVGAGGMGEVYRARDPRLGREVAVKILPSAFSEEAERLRRFEQEARAAGALNHPNVLAVHDVGSHEGVPYIVSELLAGETLRARIGGSPLPLRKSLDYAVQIARGLAAAHEKGIVHRDLKPENLFVTRDGRVKILDFGLAKLGPEAAVAPGSPDAELSELETATETLPGTLLGTLGYMSPEQVQGHPADARSDIFAFGAVLYEMLTGQRAFRAPTAPETLTAILKADPLEARTGEVALSPGLERVVRHCLEKSPDERFQSARDLAFALEALSGLSDAPASRAGEGTAARGWRTTAWAAAAAVLAAGLGVLAGWALWKSEPTRLSQMTFRAGAISSARFSPDGQTVVYSAAWDGGPLELYTKRVSDRESRRLGLRGARVLSISRSGELAVQLVPAGASLAYFFPHDGTLARVPLAGGTPRALIEDVQGADWSPDGSELAVSRWVDGRYRVEYPVGVVLYESENRLPIVRVSPDGGRVAFLEEVSMAVPNTGRLHVVDRSGQDRTLAETWGTIGLAWSPGGREVWIDLYEETAERAIRAVTLSGDSRLLLQLGGGEASLLDVSDDERVLLVQGHGRYVIFGAAPGDPDERNLSWNDDASVVDLSRDGQTLLFAELLSGGGRSFGTSVRSMDGSPAVRLGDGYAFALSPDGRWALAFTAVQPPFEFVLLPTGAGEARHLSEGLPAEFYGASWLPDSRAFVFSGGSPGDSARLYLQDIRGGAPRLLSHDEPDLTGPLVSPDGSTIAGVDGYGATVTAPLAGGAVRVVPGVNEGERPVQWTANSRALYVYRKDRLPVEVFEVDVATGGRRLVKEIALHGPSGIDPSHVVLALTPDAAGYAYSYRLALDELYLVTGLDR